MRLKLWLRSSKLLTGTRPKATPKQTIVKHTICEWNLPHHSFGLGWLMFDHEVKQLRQKIETVPHFCRETSTSWLRTNMKKHMKLHEDFLCLALHATCIMCNLGHSSNFEVKIKDVLATSLFCSETPAPNFLLSNQLHARCCIAPMTHLGLQ